MSLLWDMLKDSECLNAFCSRHTCRSKFAALYRQLWRLHMSEKVLLELGNVYQTTFRYFVCLFVCFLCWERKGGEERVFQFLQWTPCLRPYVTLLFLCRMKCYFSVLSVMFKIGSLHCFYICLIWYLFNHKNNVYSPLQKKKL